jgi:hypothetical protein
MALQIYTAKCDAGERYGLSNKHNIETRIMKVIKKICCLIMPAFMIGHQAAASDLEELAMDGYAVVEKTQASGEFNGCDFDKRVPLDDGLVFVCSSYNYSYSYRPEVLILKNIQSGNIKVLIDNDEYEGTLYKQ